MALVNTNTANKLKCCTDCGSTTSVVFQTSANNTTLAVTKGSETLSEFSLKDFAFPVSTYATQSFVLKALTSVNVNQWNLGNSDGEVKMLVLAVTYPTYDSSDVKIESKEKYIKFLYPEGGQTMNIGPLMVLSGTDKTGSGWDLDASPGGMIITNPHVWDVTIRVFIAS